jgi:pimeloyl-ACP methyl ester carboxylesterase
MLDRPGCGLSEPLATPPDGIAGIETYADSLIADLLDALGLAESHVVATSYGGYFALRGAAAHPDRIDRILEFSWTVGAPMAKVPLVMRLGSVGGVGWLMARVPPTERAVRMMLRQIGLGGALDSGRFDHASLDWYVALLRNTHTMRNEIQASPKLVSPIRGLNERVLLPAPLLADVRSPVYFLWGADDPNGGADAARRFVRLFANAELEVMAAAGHAPWIDDPDHAAAVARSFFERSD